MDSPEIGELLTKGTKREQLDGLTATAPGVGGFRGLASAAAANTGEVVSRHLLCHIPRGFQIAMHAAVTTWCYSSLSMHTKLPNTGATLCCMTDVSHLPSEVHKYGLIETGLGRH